ncbi:unnamed protein product [Cuscuta campestris]|uniref:FHA domain-containing protein n=1 Tax=Cuscuta campestris TaxID=132261 RepID=A0A484MEH0_9ASTE|nr:unnamed protein product [Cuscuta campestris]
MEINQHEHGVPVSAKLGERTIPVFTVLKNNAILKNIFLIDNQPWVDESHNESEEILVVGRHPDCDITLEHPSISRFHLRIYSKPSSQSLSVVDLSSVHGTWIAGKKIESGVRINLEEGDMMQLGGSSRVYRLHWVPLSRAYDLDNPFVPPILLQSEPSLKEEEEEEEEEVDHQVDARFLDKQDEMLVKNDMLEKQDAVYSDTDVPFANTLPSSPPALPEEINYPAACEEKDADVDNQSLLKDLFLSSDVGEPALTPEEDCIFCSLPLGSFRNLNELYLRTRSTMKSSLLKVAEADGVAALDEENESVTKSDLIPDIQFCFKDPSLSGEKGSCPEKENCPSSSLPLSLLTNTNEFDLKNGSTLKSLVLKVDEASNDIVTTDEEKVTADIHFMCAFDADNEIFSPERQTSSDEEKLSPISVPLKSLSVVKTGSIIKSSEEVVGYKEVDKEDDEKEVPDIKNLTLNIRSRYVDEEEISNPDKENLVHNSLSFGSVKNANEFSVKSGSSKKSPFPNVDEIDEETTATSIIESITLDEEEMCTPLKKTCEVELESPSSIKLPIPDMDGGDEEVLTPDKHNETLDGDVADNEMFSPDKQMFTANEEVSPISVPVRSFSDVKTYEESSVTLMEESLALDIHILNGGDMDDKEIGTPPLKEKIGEVDLENQSTTKLSIPNMGDGVEETVTAYKQNEKSSAHILRSMKHKGTLQNKENITPNIWRSMDKIGKSRNNKSNSQIGGEDVNSRSHECEGMAVNKENHNERALQEQRNKQEGIPMQSTPKDYDRLPFQSVLVNSSIVTDSINPGVEEKTHHLSEPKVREEKMSWCMVVDTTTLLKKESRKAMQLLEGLKCTSLLIPHIVIRELECMKSGASFLKRTTESSDEAASTNAEDHILKYALSQRKINSSQKRLVLLSDDLALKIRSMAEGLQCETAKDFRESLVNPFSERFLWNKSTPRGKTWSYADDIVLKETFYQRPLNRPHSNHGLKLILLYKSSQYIQFSSSLLKN